MVRCSVFRCTNNTNDGDGPRITFYRFPKDEERRKMWIDALNRENWEPTKHSRVCSEHFEDRYKIKTPRKFNWLTSDAIPTIFPGDPSEDETTESDPDPPMPIEIVQVDYHPVPPAMVNMERKIENMTHRCAEQNRKIKMLQLENKRDAQKIINMKRVITKLKDMKQGDCDENLQLLIVYE